MAKRLYQKIKERRERKLYEKVKARTWDAIQAGPELVVSDDLKLLITGDGHWGNGKDRSDDMMTSDNEKLYRQVVMDHGEDGYSHIENGDGPELWENHINAVLTAYGNTLLVARDHYAIDPMSGKKLRTAGNHDPEKYMRKGSGTNFYRDVAMPKAIRLGDAGFITHGYLGDWWCDTASPFSRWVVWNIWRELQKAFGWSTEPGRSYLPSKNEAQATELERVWVRLCEEWDLLGVFSHLHVSMSIGRKYINTGSLLVPGRTFGVLITGRRVDQVMFERTAQSRKFEVPYKVHVANTLWLVDRHQLRWHRQRNKRRGWKKSYFVSEGGEYMIARPPKSPWKLWGPTFRVPGGQRRRVLSQSNSIDKLKDRAEQHKRGKQQEPGKN